jgi:chemotaxis protein MotA
MDLATIIGILIALAALLGGNILEGGHASALLNLPAAIIVFGGTIGATMICFSLQDVKNFPNWLKVAFQEKQTDAHKMIRTIVDLADMARREGILKLESVVETIDSDFLRQGISLVIDGTDYEVTKSILETEVEFMRERHHTGAKFFDAAGGFAPTMGIIGTVMGLVHVLGSLEDTANLGSAIAVAFIATLYGVFSANVIWLPIGAKLKARSKQEAIAREIIIEGVLAIQAGESPRIIEDRLKSFLSPENRAKQTEADAQLSAVEG